MPALYIGLLSGTSVDSIDAVLVDFSDDTPALIASSNKPWPPALRDTLLQTRALADEQLNSLTELDLQTGELFAQAALELLQQTGIAASDIRAIGSHGQTIRHRPDADKPFSLQIGNAERIAELTRIDVVSDFRAADIAAGGQGAPLVPAFHQAVFRSRDADRVIVNIGGIANITVLAKDEAVPVTGFDTGPGNNLMDAWIAEHRQQTYDADGQLAASGKTDAGLLARLLMDDYFQLTPPKSTGFEHFNLEWLKPYLDDDYKVEDVQSTLCDLTATSIIRAINQYAPNTDEIYVCGGGAHNTELMKRLQSMSRPAVMTTAALGIEPDWVEAITFAWLAHCKIRGINGNLPCVTGADKHLILGKLIHPRESEVA